MKKGEMSQTHTRQEENKFMQDILKAEGLNFRTQSKIAGYS
jgi:hypothetical protein